MNNNNNNNNDNNHHDDQWNIVSKESSSRCSLTPPVSIQSTSTTCISRSMERNEDTMSDRYDPLVVSLTASGHEKLSSLPFSTFPYSFPSVQPITLVDAMMLSFQADAMRHPYPLPPCYSSCCHDNVNETMATTMLTPYALDRIIDEALHIVDHITGTIPSNHEHEQQPMPLRTNRCGGDGTNDATNPTNRSNNQGQYGPAALPMRIIQRNTNHPRADIDHRPILSLTTRSCSHRRHHQCDSCRSNDDTDQNHQHHRPSN
jgi:hypothetical protein